MQTTHDLRTADGIRAFFADVANTLVPSDFQRKVTYRALQAMYARQTADEQAMGGTVHHNGMGFSGIDSAFLSDVARSSQRYENLTPKQAIAVAKRLQRYTRQLAEVAQANSARKAEEVAPAASPAPAATEEQEAAPSANPAAWIASASDRHKSRRVRRNVPAAPLKGWQIGPDGLTNSERAFDALCVEYGVTPTPAPCAALPLGYPCNG